MFDTLIRGGSIVDGTGKERFTADIAIADGRIVEIGKLTSPARETIDADGALVTPGFVDVHSHYDGQVLWDDRLDPSFSHGVTTVIGGNCGVGFAPVEPEHRKALVELMEGVEEIPGIVLDEGLDWQWRSFPDYLDRLAQRSYAMDIATHIAHAPLRVFVMGERALNHEPANEADIAAMAGLVREAMAAGAVGFSGARVLEHLSSKGAHVPGTFAADDELLGLAAAMGQAGHGVFQIIPLGTNGDLMFGDGDIGNGGRSAEHARIAEIARVAGRPVTYVLAQYRSDPEDWRAMLAASGRCRAEGLDVVPQVGARGIGAMTTLDGYHVFMLRRSYDEIAQLPLAERVKALREPSRRAAILAERSDPAIMARDPQLGAFIEMLAGRIANIFPMTLPLDYEPGESQRLGELARQAGKTNEEFLYDHYVTGDGANVCASFMLNFPQGNLDATHAMLADPLTASGLGDGGAHMRMACDAAITTFQLSFWTRDRKRGPVLSVEHMVRKLTSRNAELYGFADRGRIAPGLRADINVIDYANLGLRMPRMTFDLPAGGGRMLQRSQGYLATLVSGTATRRNDTDTGARPGRLLRGGRA